MLDLRGLYFAESEAEQGQSTLHWTDVRFKGFSSALVGNLGATLDISTSAAMIPGDEDFAPVCHGPDEWEDEVPHYSNGPFKTGLKHPDTVSSPAGDVV